MSEILTVERKNDKNAWEFSDTKISLQKKKTVEGILTKNIMHKFLFFKEVSSISKRVLNVSKSGFQR